MHTSPKYSSNLTKLRFFVNKMLYGEVKTGKLNFHRKMHLESMNIYSIE